MHEENIFQGEAECKDRKLTVAILQMRENGGFDHDLEEGMVWNSYSLGLFYR